MKLSKKMFWAILPMMILLLIVSSANAATKVVTLDGTWKIKTDPENQGKAENWQNAPLTETVDIPVPGILQQVFRDYHGVVWYERLFETPVNPNANGRAILKFWQAEYYAQVWINEHYVGEHEGGESVFEFDVTQYLNPAGESNRIVVRIIHPTEEPIETFSSFDVPKRNSTLKITPGCDYYTGGLIDSVELLLTPEVRISDIFLLPDWKTGQMVTKVTFENFGDQTVSGKMFLKASKTTSNEWSVPVGFDATLPPGTTLVERSFPVPNYQLWSLESPNLYNVLVDWVDADGQFVEQKSARSGFRDFRFENGYFRLNGKRIFLKSSHTGQISPITYRLPLEPDTFKKDILYCKTMKFNMIRQMAGMPRRDVLDFCDEIGFLFYDECNASWMLGESPYRTDRLYRQTEGLLRRDRNHPCIVIWGFQNETTYLPNVYDMIHFLPRARQLDPSRLIILDSGSMDWNYGNDWYDGDTVAERYPWNEKKAGFSTWRKNLQVMPAAIKNMTDNVIQFDGVDWPAQTFVLHPGDFSREYAVVKWTAPKADNYKIDAKFCNTAVARPATIEINFFKGQELFGTTWLNLNGAGSETSFSDQKAFQSGEELFLVVGVGNGDGFSDAAAASLQITDSEGKVYDVCAEYSVDANPNGVWTYGWLPRSEKPNLAEFTPFETAQKEFHYPPTGRISNPESPVWENVLIDTHPYWQVPHRNAEISRFRTNHPYNLPVFVSEYGIGSGLNLNRLTRLFEQHQATESLDAIHYKDRFDKFQADWNQYGLDDTFYSYEQYFEQTLAWMADQRRYGINAIRANPFVVGHSVTGTVDQGITGEGLTTLFREFKPGTLEAMADVFSPLRFSLFVEPVQVFRGKSARFDAVLVNEDILKPGKYPVRYMIVGPDNRRFYDKTTTLVIPEPEAGQENPIAIPVFSEEIVVDGPAGEYRFLATFLENAAANGGWEKFFVYDPADMPKLERQYVVWGNDPDLLDRLAKIGIDAVAYVKEDGSTVELNENSILIAGRSNNLGMQVHFDNLYKEIANGASIVFLDFGIFKKDDQSTGFLPFEEKGRYPSVVDKNWNGLYHPDSWNKRHPFFAGLPSGNILDFFYYREVIPRYSFAGQPLPDEIVAGEFNTTLGYDSGLTLGLWNYGKGKIVLNTFLIQENLAKDPIAERMLRNILLYLEK